MLRSRCYSCFSCPFFLFTTVNGNPNNNNGNAQAATGSDRTLPHVMYPVEFDLLTPTGSTPVTAVATPWIQWPQYDTTRHIALQIGRSNSTAAVTAVAAAAAAAAASTTPVVFTAANRRCCCCLVPCSLITGDFQAIGYVAVAALRLVAIDLTLLWLLMLLLLFSASLLPLLTHCCC